MLPEQRLPPELWLIILELARESGPQPYCNYLTFPHLNLHFLRPSEHAFTIHLWPLTFRLICSCFNSLLKTPPAFFMKDADSAIPVSTRAVYILPQREPGPQVCLQRVLADPSTRNRITILNLPGCEGPIYSPPTNFFDFLCDNAHSLPAVRTLTLGVRIPGSTAPEIPGFWWRLNKAFPLLTTFVIRGGLSTNRDAKVVFKHLEVISWDSMRRHTSFQFPALRHASFGSYMLRRFANPVLLESLLVRSLSPGSHFEWSAFPNLRLLGLPAQRTTNVFPLLPPYHPLQHLYVFMCTRDTDDPNKHLFGYAEELRWLKETINHMPTITRLSLWFDKRPQNHLNSIPGYFGEEDLEPLGFAQREFPPRNCENGYHAVFERSIRG